MVLWQATCILLGTCVLQCVEIMSGYKLAVTKHIDYGQCFLCFSNFLSLLENSATRMLAERNKTSSNEGQQREKLVLYSIGYVKSG